MARRRCPVCRTGWILRHDLKTCSPHCSKEWRNWNPERRAKAMEDAEDDGRIITPEQLDKWRKEVAKEVSVDEQEEKSIKDYMSSVIGGEKPKDK